MPNENTVVIPSDVYTRRDAEFIHELISDFLEDKHHAGDIDSWNFEIKVNYATRPMDE